MLVLQRTASYDPLPERELVIQLEDGREISVCLVRTDGKYGRIGIKAPATVRVDRREVLNARSAAQ